VQRQHHVALFPGLLRLPFLIACSTQKLLWLFNISQSMQFIKLGTQTSCIKVQYVQMLARVNTPHGTFFQLIWG